MERERSHSADGAHERHDAQIWIWIWISISVVLGRSLVPPACAITRKSSPLHKPKARTSRAALVPGTNGLVTGTFPLCETPPPGIFGCSKAVLEGYYKRATGANGQGLLVGKADHVELWSFPGRSDPP